MIYRKLVLNNLFIKSNILSRVIERANDQSYNKSEKMGILGLEISATTEMNNVRKK